MKSEKFTGTYLEQLAMCFAQLQGHQDHFLYFGLLNLDIAEIRCGKCRVGVIEGSRELLELLWLEWSMQQLEP